MLGCMDQIGKDTTVISTNLAVTAMWCAATAILWKYAGATPGAFWGCSP
jgi:hypothetical protein